MDKISQAIRKNGILVICSGLHFQDEITGEKYQVHRGDLFVPPASWTELSSSFQAVRVRIGQGAETYETKAEMTKRRDELISQARRDLIIQKKAEIGIFIKEWLAMGKLVTAAALGSALKAGLLRPALSIQMWQQSALDDIWKGLVTDYGWEPGKDEKDV